MTDRLEKFMRYVNRGDSDGWRKQPPETFGKFADHFFAFLRWHIRPGGNFLQRASATPAQSGLGIIGADLHARTLRIYGHVCGP